MADVQIAVIDDTENVVNVAVPGIQGPIGTTGSVTIAQAGTAATPGIRFESDTNTGIYSPGADQLAISTGGTGRLFVDGNGNVATGLAAFPKAFTVNNVNAAIELRANSGGAGFTAYSDHGLFFAVDATKYAQIYNDGVGQLVFRNGAGLTERMRIDSSGRVGIGTSSPDALLHVATASGTASELRIATGGVSSTATLRIGQVGAIFWDQQITTTSGNYLLKIDGGGDAYRVERAGSAVNTHIFSTAGSERARIDSSGRLLVGTSTSTGHVSIEPNFQMAGSNYANGTIGLRVENTNANTAPGIFLARSRGSSATIVVDGDRVGFINFAPADGAGYGSSAARIDCNIDGTPGAGDTPGRLVFSTTADGASSPTERLRITSTGNVGIGTSSPGTTLHVQGSATITSQANVAAKIGANTDSDVLIGSINGNTPFIASQGAYPLALFTNALERARIDSSGRLLVGTSSARGIASANAAFFVVETNSSALGISCVRNTNDGTGGIVSLGKSRGPAIGSVTVVQDGDAFGEIRFAGADNTDLESIGASIAAAVDGTPGANDMPGRLVFSTTADGAATPTERLRITSAGVLQVADAGNISVGTTTGTKIGTATTQKLGFYNATPVVQPTAVADATDAASVITQLNALLTRMRNLGLIAT